MFKYISYKELISGKIKEYAIIDVRSPDEYDKDTIPGAINIPIFDNDERKKVGTLYKQVSIEDAREEGVKIVSKKLPKLYNEIVKLKEKNKELVFFCARGGYRSSSIVTFLQSIGHKNIWKLDGGYKSYRHYINENLDDEVKKVKYIVLYGNTGSGKTKILKSLEKKGADVIDLEGYANHRGSTLGAVGLNEQNSQKKFESLIYHKLINRKTNTFFIEGESRRIGRVLIPETLFESIINGIHVGIDTDIDMRVDIILDDYVNGHNDEIIEALHYLRKRVGNEAIDEYIEKVKENDFRYVAKELMINYYDPMYEHHDRKHVKIFENKNIDKTADDLIKWAAESNYI